MSGLLEYRGLEQAPADVPGQHERAQRRTFLSDLWQDVCPNKNSKRSSAQAQGGKTMKIY